jgi:hypothetical protein
MREIKFRGELREIKSGKNKTGDLMEGDYKHRWEYFDLLGIRDIYFLNGLAVKDDWELINVGQFTGLTDRKGKEIYDGDLIKDPNGQVGKIFWNDSNAQFAVNWKMKDGSYETDTCFGYGEVIGNIYENPKLLTQ